MRCHCHQRQHQDQEGQFAVSFCSVVSAVDRLVDSENHSIEKEKEFFQ